MPVPTAQDRKKLESGAYVRSGRRVFCVLCKVEQPGKPDKYVMENILHPDKDPIHMTKAQLYGCELVKEAQKMETPQPAPPPSQPPSQPPTTPTGPGPGPTQP